MNVKLKARTADHVKTYWERTKDPEIRALIPIAELTFEESLQQYEESLFPGASSFGRVIYADGCYLKKNYGGKG